LLGLRGLDRLYFTHVGSADALTAPAPVAALLPRTLPALPARTPSPAADGEEIAFQDFPVPLPNAPGRVSLRQVNDSSHPRISELWLALYDQGRRSDVWHFQAYPNPDGKLLPNYWIESTHPGPGGGVVLRLRGSMFRPQGAWWATGKLVTLTATEGALRFAHVRNAFGFLHEYDRGDGADPPTDVRTEREVGGRFEMHDLDPAPEALMKGCGLDLSSEGIPDDWDEVQKIADCISGAPGHSVSSRTPQEPSYPERGFTFKN
jgi:hypothetical protein